MQSKENKQFAEKCMSNSSLKSKMTQTSQKFKEFQQLALYTDEKEFSPKMFINIRKQDEHFWTSNPNERTNLVMIMGIHQPQGAKSIEKIVLNLVNFVPQPSQPYSVIFLNTLVSSNAYGDFKNILQFLPFEYLYYLDKIYVVNAHFKHKASYWIKFDLLTTYIKNKTVHVSNYRELADRLKLSPEKLIDVLPRQIVEFVEKKEEWVKDYQNQKRAKECIVYNTDIFNVQKDDYLERSNKKLAKGLFKMKVTQKQAQNSIESYEVGQTGAPLILQLLLSYFNGKEELLDSEGLFRKSVDCEEQATLLKQLSLRNYNYIQQINDPHLIANAIKKLLFNMVQPIIPFKDYELLMQLSQEQYKVNILQIVNTLPNNRKMTLLLLIQFFKEKFLPRTKANKMTQNNICIVIGPCLMRSEIASLKDIADAKKVINITLILFQDFDDLFGGKKERTQLIRKSVQMQERQSLKQKLGQFQHLCNTQDISDIKDTQPLPEPSQIQKQQQSQTSNILKQILCLMQQELQQTSQLQQQQQFQQPMLIDDPSTSKQKQQS